MYYIIKGDTDVANRYGGSKLPKIVDVDEKKKLISDKALEVFCTKGYYNTNMDDIAKACDIGRSTLYDYFKNKDAIFLYTMESFFDTLDGNMEEINKVHTLDTISKIKSIFNIVFDAYIELAPMSLMILDTWAILYRDKPELLGDTKIRMHKYRELLSEILRAGVEKKEIKKLNPVSMGITLLSLIDSLIFAMQITKTTDDINLFIKDVSLILDGLRY